MHAGQAHTEWPCKSGKPTACFSTAIMRSSSGSSALPAEAMLVEDICGMYGMACSMAWHAASKSLPEESSEESSSFSLLLSTRGGARCWDDVSIDVIGCVGIWNAKLGCRTRMGAKTKNAILIQHITRGDLCDGIGGCYGCSHCVITSFESPVS